MNPQNVWSFKFFILLKIQGHFSAQEIVHKPIKPQIIHLEKCIIT